MSFPIPDFEQADVRKLAVQMLDYSKYLQRNTTKEDARRDLAERLARDGILLFSYEVPEKIVTDDAPPRLLPCSPKTRTLSDYSTGC